MTNPVESNTVKLAEDEFARLLGESIARWQQVELHLCGLFHALHGGDDRDIPNAIYHAVHSFEVKLAMIDALIRTRPLNAAISSRWATLQRAIKRRKQIRDKFVHWSIVSLVPNKVFEGVFLTPPISDFRIYNRPDYMKPSSGMMSADDLRRHGEEFDKQAQEVREFRGQVLTALPKKSR
ncbi:MAG TPA: hypothetical protein VGR63_09515 [Casimicrobiaceae bacterium]|jgi:hypothetical protein|nr:hypothetical protein [Casimicrobiaceae bacterium]